MNVMNDPHLRKQSPGVAATINGQQITRQQVAEECLQRHGREVLEGEINRRLLLQALKQKGAEVTERDLDLEMAARQTPTDSCSAMAPPTWRSGWRKSPRKKVPPLNSTFATRCGLPWP